MLNAQLTRQRVHYADVAKGILIILLFLHHIHIRSELYDIRNNVTSALDMLDDYWVMFFMAAFFVVSAMFSRYDKPFKTFLPTNFKSLIIPSVTLGVLSGIIYQSTIGEFGRYGYLSTIKNAVVHFFIYGGKLWFCSALFCAKMIYWLLNRYLGKYIKFSCIVISIIGVILGYLYNQQVITLNFWYLIHAFIFIIFIPIGIQIKKYDIPKTMVILLPLYLIIVYVLQQFNLVVQVTYLFTYKGVDVIIFYIMAIVGTILVISMSKCIDSNKFLEYIGRNSLIFYGIHPIFNMILTFYLKDVIVKSPLLVQIGVYLFIFFCLICICSLISCILNTKYLRYLIGKF